MLTAGGKPVQAAWHQNDQGTWEYFSDETGEKEAPGLTPESVCYLLDNVFLENGLYQNEVEPLKTVLIYEDEKSFTIGVGAVVDPEHYRYYNQFSVDKKTGEAYSRFTKHRFWLLGE